MKFLLVCLVLCAPLAVAAEPPAAGVSGIVVSDGWIRQVPPVSRNSAGYLVVENRGAADDMLLGASVEGVRVTELHEMVRKGDTLMMQRRPAIAVPAGGQVALAPGGLHLMLIDLQRPLQAGEKRAAVLRFRDAGEREVVLEVRAPREGR